MTLTKFPIKFIVSITIALVYFTTGYSQELKLLSREQVYPPIDLDNYYNKEYRIFEDVFRTYTGKDVNIYVGLNKGSSTAKIVIENNSCFTLEYRVVISFYSSNNRRVAIFNEKGKISSTSKNIIYHNAKNATYYEIEYPQIKFQASYSGTLFTISKKEFEKLPNDSYVSRCLGFANVDEFAASWQRKTMEFRRKQKQAEDLEKQKKEKALEEERKKKELERKNWDSKGLEYHLQTKEKARISGFHTKTSLDSLLLFAKLKKEPMLMINGGTMRLSTIAPTLDAEAIEILNTIVASYDVGYPKDLFAFNKKYNLGIKQTPVIVVLDPNGKVLFNQALPFGALKKNLNQFIKSSFKRKN